MTTVGRARDSIKAFDGFELIERLVPKQPVISDTLHRMSLKEERRAKGHEDHDPNEEVQRDSSEVSLQDMRGTNRLLEDRPAIEMRGRDRPEPHNTVKVVGRPMGPDKGE